MPLEADRPPNLHPDEPDRTILRRVMLVIGILALLLMFGGLAYILSTP